MFILSNKVLWTRCKQSFTTNAMVRLISSIQTLFLPKFWPKWHQMKLICQKSVWIKLLSPFQVTRLHSWIAKLLTWNWHPHTQLLIRINCLINMLSNRLTVYIIKCRCLGKAALYEKWLLGVVRWFIDTGFRHMTVRESRSAFCVSVQIPISEPELCKPLLNVSSTTGRQALWLWIAVLLHYSFGP